MAINWLASYPKSGSTWVRMLLAAYRNKGELDINDPGHSVGDLHLYFHQVVSPKPAMGLDLGAQVLIRPAALAHLMVAYAHINPLVVKTHYANTMVDDIATIPPGVTERAIYVVRDPRDEAISYANHFKISLDESIEAMANEQRTIQHKQDGLSHLLSSWSTHVESWLSEQRFPVTVLRYERLMEDTHSALAGLLERLGEEDIDAERIALAVDAARLDRLRGQEKTNGFRESPKGVQFFNRGGSWWRGVLTEEQQQRIEADHGAMMRQLGYLTDDARALQNIA